MRRKCDEKGKKRMIWNDCRQKRRRLFRKRDEDVYRKEKGGTDDKVDDDDVSKNYERKNV